MAKEIQKEDLPKIKELIRKILKADEYKNLTRMGGLTNHTYKVTLNDGRNYVVRIPGEGTEDLIVRSDEKKSTTLACDLEIDARLLYFGDEGSKVTEYIPEAVTMNGKMLQEPRHMRQCAEIFKKLHTSGKSTGVPFEVFDMATGYEEIIHKHKVSMYDDYENVKKKVGEIKKTIDLECHADKVPCHNDALCENWVESGDGRMYLIDWEYAGMNDGMWDVADVSIEADYSPSQDNEFLEYYLGNKPSKLDMLHFLASKIYVDYLWTLWAKARVPYDGQPMEDWASERYARLKKNIRAYDKVMEG